MKRKIAILVVLSLEALILWGCKLEKEQSIDHNVIIITKMINSAIEQSVETFAQTYEEMSYIDIAIKDSLEEEIIEDGKEDPPIINNEEKMNKQEEDAPISSSFTLPITSRSAHDVYPDIGETIATISIPTINLYQPIVYGDSQSNIDTYEVCMRAGNRFNQAGAKVLAGHNFKSFANLFYLTNGDTISIHSYYGDYNYRITNIQSGITDGFNIYDENRKDMIDLYGDDSKLYLYTCDDRITNGRLVVSAIPI